MEIKEIDLLMKKYFQKPIPSLYESEFIFYFYSLIFLHIQNVPVKKLYELQIKPNFFEFMKQYENTPSKAIKRNLPEQELNKEQKELLKYAIDLFDLLNKENLLENLENISKISISFLYTITEQSTDLKKYVLSKDITWIINLLTEKIYRTINKKTICDPYCGTGSLLAKLILENQKSKIRIIGYEKNQKIADICEVLLYFSGAKSFKTEQEDIINMNNKKFDLIVSCIPFGNRNEYYILQNMMKSLKIEGSIIAVIPNGVLFRLGKDAVLRKSWIWNNQLDTIISLPENMLYNTRIPVSIIVLKKTRKSRIIQFIECAHDIDGIIISRKQNTLNSEAKSKLKKALLSNNNEEIENYSRFVPITEIVKNEYFLNAEKYIVFNNNNYTDNYFNYLKEIEKVENELFNIQKELKRYYDEY